MKQLLTVQDVAQMLQLSVRKIWEMRDCGHLPSPVRFGRSVRWRQSDIEAWIADGCPVLRGNRKGKGFFNGK